MKLSRRLGILCALIAAIAVALPSRVPAQNLTPLPGLSVYRQLYPGLTARLARGAALMPLRGG